MEFVVVVLVVLGAVGIIICQLFILLLKSTFVGQLQSQHGYKTNKEMNDEGAESELFKI
jgi:hypothetical protein